MICSTVIILAAALVQGAEQMSHWIPPKVSVNPRYAELLEKANPDLTEWVPLRKPLLNPEEYLEKTTGLQDFAKLIEQTQKKKPIKQAKLANTPLSPIWKPTLDDAEMTKYTRMAMWSAASYCSQDSIVAWDCGPRCDGLTANTNVALYFKSAITDTVGFIAIYSDLDAQEDQIVITFRGSVSWTNWVEDMRFVKEPSPWPNKDYPSARVHSGFLDSYSDIATTIRSSIMVLTKRFPTAKIIITGHSLGGAVATLCASDLKFHLGRDYKIELVTYHSPRVGNEQFAGFMAFIFDTEKVDPAVGNYMTRRFTNRDDPLCHLPPSWLDFLHLPQEVWVNLENETKACDPAVVEDPNCSNSVLMPDDVFSHFYIWDVSFGTDCSK